MRKFLKSDKFLILISVLLSIFLWIGMSFSSGSEFTKTISDIPVTVELSQEAIDNGYQIFGLDHVTASVSVTGNRMIVGSLTKSDIQIKAQQTSSITTAGTYTLPLAASKTGVKSDYEFSSAVSPSTIVVNVDRYQEKTLDITSEIVYKVDSGYYSRSVLGDTSVVVSGPESVVSKVSKAVVRDTISGTITETRELTSDIILLDEDGDVINNSDLSMSVTSTAVTIIVEPEKELPIVVPPEGVPSDLDLSKYITVEPSTIRVAGDASVMNNLDSIPVEPIDISNYDNSVHTVEVQVAVPSSCRNISNINTVTVTIDFSSLSMQTYTVTQFEKKNIPDGYTADVPLKQLDVQLIGTEEALSSITSEDLVAYVDWSEMTEGIVIGTSEMPVKIEIPENSGYVWVYGTYNANVTVSKVETTQ